MAISDRISELMRKDWDRRINHDYRFWMSDGHCDDKTMWETGERDFSIITQDLENTKDKSLLEIGCGVGRLLHTAITRFRHVTGLDVSEKAIQKVKELLGNPSNLDLILGNGVNLQPVADRCIDVVISFAALSSMPVEVFANYLREARRVIKDDGVVRFQLYLGKEQMVSQDDTLHLRCFTEENFRRAVQASGFELEWVQELVLPFKVSFKEIGIVAVVTQLKPAQCEVLDSSAIAKLLLPAGESTQELSEGISDLEYWMTLNYAKELVERGEIEHAKQTLEYGLNISKTHSVDTQDILQRIVSEIEKGSKAKSASVTSSNPGYYEKNLGIISQRFPHLVAELENAQIVSDIEVRDSLQGPVIFERAQCLDHSEKPISSAQTWVNRTLQEERVRNASSLIIFGAGACYHVEHLIAQTKQFASKEISLIEPNVSVFKAAITARDLSQLLTDLTNLCLGNQQVPNFIDQYSELIVRPQSQALHSKYCADIRAAFYGARGISALRPTIAVLGPLMGGTLPIAAYTLRGLDEHKQRTRDINVSGFAPGYGMMDKFVFNRLRQNQLENVYCEMISQVVLETIEEKPIDILVCMAQAPISGRALMALRAKGVITVLWFVEDYLRFTYWKEMAKYYDFVFTIQKGECIDAIKAAGAGEVHYLPVGCDPFVHTPQDLSAQDMQHWGSPISFVGAGYHNRQQMFAALADMPFKIWGTEWPNCRPFDRLLQEEGRRLTPGEYVKIFNASKINLNLHSSTERDGVDPSGDFINPRCFELASCAAFQLVDQRSLLNEVFTPGKDIVTFNNINDLKEKIHYYLNHEDERKSIARNARQTVLEKHTYYHRIQQMLSKIYSSQFERLKRRWDSSPWHKTISRAKKHTELHQRCETAFKRGEEPNLDGLISDVIGGKGKLSETEQKLLFLYHVKKQIVRMKREEAGEKQ